MTPSNLPYLRFWEKDLTKGFHYIFKDAHVDIWAHTDNLYNVIRYTSVLHTANPSDIRVCIVSPECIKSFQNAIVSANEVSDLINSFDLNS